MSGNPFGGFKSPLPFYNPQTIDKSFQTFNPWQNYNTPQDNAGWNYNNDPYFNAAANKPQWDLAQTGAGTEDDRARVWRFTIDTLHQAGLDPGSAPAEAVQRAYLNSIARLKRDYMDPSNQAKGMNWANSAYAGYDKFLNYTTNSNPENGQPAPGQRGAPVVAPPNNGSPINAPTSTPPPVVPPTPAPNPAAPPATGPANSSQFNTVSADWLRAHPDEALHQAFLQQGIDITRPGPLQDFIRSRYAPLMSDAIGTAGVINKQGAMQVMPDLLNTFAQMMQKGATPLATLQQNANAQLGGNDLQTYLNMLPDQSDAIKYYAQLQRLRTADMNPMVQSALTAELQRQAQNYTETYPFQQAQAGKETSPFMDWWKNSPWAKFFQP